MENQADRGWRVGAASRDSTAAGGGGGWLKKCEDELNYAEQRARTRLPRVAAPPPPHKHARHPDRSGIPDRQSLVHAKLGGFIMGR